MNELIKTEVQNDEVVVSGRELHEFLEVGTQYSKWFERMVEYGFEKNIDYVDVSQKRLTSHGREHSQTNHAIKLDMAKEIAMIQRTPQGRAARQFLGKLNFLE